MAMTVTPVDKTVWGNKALTVFKVTADGSASAIATGFKVLSYVWYAPNSCTSLGLALKINCTNTTAAVNGSIKVGAMTSGDDFYIYAVGH